MERNGNIQLGSPTFIGGKITFLRYWGATSFEGLGPTEF